MDLAGLTWEEPAGLGIRETERRYRAAEKRRVIYVAATRARDLLVIPKAGEVQPGRFVCGDLLEEAPERLIRTMEAYVEGSEPAWARQLAPSARPVPGGATELEQRVASIWERASREASRPRFRPASVSGESRGDLLGELPDPAEMASS